MQQTSQSSRRQTEGQTRHTGNRGMRVGTGEGDADENRCSVSNISILLGPRRG